MSILDTATSHKKDPSQYRPCVGIMMVKDDGPDAGKAFVGKRIDTREGDWWQMPQGGVDEGEDLEKAMLRELEEETGVKLSHVKIVGPMADELFYDLPKALQGKLWKGRYIGQRQVWFLIRFTGEASDIDLNAHEHPEFCEWKWVPIDQLPNLIIPFKKTIYQTVVDGFRDKI